MRLRFLVLIGLVVGLTLGVVLAIVFGRTADSPGVDSDPEPVVELAEGQQTSVEIQQQRREEFLVDWARFRSVEVLVESNLTRVTSDGTELTVTEVLAQRPGDRLVRSLSGVTGYLGGVEVLCSTRTSVEEGGELECRDLDTAPSIDEALQTELGNIGAVLDGDPPTYRLFVTDEGCWELLLTTETFDAPFGESAIYCFDAGTGTLSSSETTFNNGLVEKTEVVNVRQEVTDDDLLAMLDEPPRE